MAYIWHVFLVLGILRALRLLFVIVLFVDVEAAVIPKTEANSVKIEAGDPLRGRFTFVSNKRKGFWKLLTVVHWCLCWYLFEGIYKVKVILTEIRHFECPNEKVEENGLVTKSSILSMESLGWPNTQIQIHKYTNMCI